MIHTKATDNKKTLEKIKNLQKNSYIMPSVSKPLNTKMSVSALEVNASKIKI